MGKGWPADQSKAVNEEPWIGKMVKIDKSSDGLCVLDIV